MKWSPDAEALIQRAPFFVRRIARRSVEEYASKIGQDFVTAELVERARQTFFRKSDVSKPPVVAYAADARAIEALIERASNLPGHSSRYYNIRVCGGAAGCPFALIDVQAQADALRDIVEASGWCEVLERRTEGPLLTHHKFRAAVAGCPNACSEPQIRDYGIIGQAKPVRSEEPCTECGECMTACREGAVTLVNGGPLVDVAICVGCELCVRACATGALAVEKTGYKVTVGGKLGRHPHLGDTLLELTDERGVWAAAKEVLALMIEKEGRLTDLIAQVGLDALRRKVNEGRQKQNAEIVRHKEQ